MPRSTEWNQEKQDMLVGLRDAGHEWDVISTMVGKSRMACAAMYAKIKSKQQHLTFVMNQQLKAKPDYARMGQHTGRD